MHLRFWKDCLLHLPILALFSSRMPHTGAEQRVMEKFSAAVDSPWMQLQCVQRRTDDVRGLSQRWSHPPSSTAQHSLSSFLPTFSCIVLHSLLLLKAPTVATRRDNLLFFFSSAESCSTGKTILGLPSWGRGREASPARPLVGLVSNLRGF